MKLSNSLCTVEITVDPTFTLESADNRPYDRVLNPREYKRRDFTRTFSIRIQLPERTLTLALIGESHSFPEDCAILENDQLLVMQNHGISRLSIWDGQLLQHTCFDCFGWLNAIYPMPDGYLIVGELAVYRLDACFRVQWQYDAPSVICDWQLGENHLKLWLDTADYREKNPSPQIMQLGFDGEPLPEEKPERHSRLTQWITGFLVKERRR